MPRNENDLFFPNDDESIHNKSEAEYVLEDGEAADIIEFTTHVRRDIHDRATRIKQPELASSSLIKPFAHETNAGLGNLDSLPLEIIRIILQSADISTLIAISQVSHYARELVLDLRECRIVAEHALEALHVIVRTELAPYYTMADICTALHQEACDVCEAFGGYLFLPLMTRRCLSCISYGPECGMLPVSKVRSLTGLNEKQVRAIPTLHTLPGKYTEKRKTHTRRNRLVSAEAVIETARKNKLTVKEELSADYDESLRCRREKTPYECTKDPEAYSFMSTTVLPYLDPVTQEVSHGVNCGGCHRFLDKMVLERGRVGLLLIWKFDQVYSNKDYVQHFKRCKEAQALWQMRKDTRKHIQA